MPNLPFPYVTVLTGDVGKTRNITSIEEASEFLMHHWPLTRGEKLEPARQACTDALHGRITCTMARDAFIEATKEAGIYGGKQILKH